MIENGYIRYKRTAEIVINEDGNPVKGNAQWSDYMPACIEGNRNTAEYNSENGIRYEKPTYTVYVRYNEAKDITDCVRLYKRDKADIGQFFVRTKEVSPIVNQIRITV